MKLAINLKYALILIAFTSLIFSVITNCTEASNKSTKSLNKLIEDEKETEKKADTKKETKKADAKKETKKPLEKKKAEKKLQKQTKESAKELAKSYIYFAKQAYCQEQKTCAACKEIESKGFKLIASEKAQSGLAAISMVINRSAEKKETVISFAGPKSNDLNFIQSIYINGFSAVAQIALNLPIESVFWDAYLAIKPKLVKQVTEIFLASEEENVIFVGHSFGGSLAILAAYDLKKTNIVNKSHKPKVITFAALKIGNIGFLKRLHSLIPIGVIRLRSIFDLYTFIPRCVYIPSLKVFHCYTSYVNLVRVWPIFARYVYTYYPIIRSKIAWAAPGVVKSAGLKALPHAAASKSMLKKPAATSLLHKKSHVKTHLQTHAKVHSNANHKVSHSRSKVISNFAKLLKHGNVNLSKHAVNSAIKRSARSSSLMAKVNRSSGLFKKLMNKSLGRSKALKQKKVSNRRRNKFTKKKSFLETSIRTTESNNGIFKRCVLRKFYLSCKYDIEVHRTFFGINIEDC